MKSIAKAFELVGDLLKVRKRREKREERREKREMSEREGRLGTNPVRCVCVL